jgi:hypothetical protein
MLEEKISEKGKDSTTGTVDGPLGGKAKQRIQGMKTKENLQREREQEDEEKKREQ